MLHYISVTYYMYIDKNIYTLCGSLAEEIAQCLADSQKKVFIPILIPLEKNFNVPRNIFGNSNYYFSLFSLLFLCNLLLPQILGDSCPPPPSALEYAPYHPIQIKIIIYL